MKLFLFLTFTFIINYDIKSQLSSSLQSNKKLDSIAVIKELNQKWILKKDFIFIDNNYWDHGKGTKKLIILKRRKISKVYVIGKNHKLTQDSMFGVLKVESKIKNKLNLLIKTINWNNYSSDCWGNFRCTNQVDSIKNFRDQIYATVGLDGPIFDVILNLKNNTRLVCFEGWSDFCSICKDIQSNFVNNFLKIVYDLDRNK